MTYNKICVILGNSSAVDWSKGRSREFEEWKWYSYSHKTAITADQRTKANNIDMWLQPRTGRSLPVCYYQVTYAFQNESILYSSLNVMEFRARNRRDIWSLSDSNGIRTHNHLVRKRTLNHLVDCVLVYEVNGCGFESRSYHLGRSLFLSHFRVNLQKMYTWSF